MLQGEILVFCLTFVLLRGRLFASIEKLKINHLWLTQIYLYRFYIPELIRLANDVQTNPPCSQGNVKVFGTANTGTQYVWQCLSALVYNFRNPITSSADLVQIMNIGNNMY